MFFPALDESRGSLLPFSDQPSLKDEILDAPGVIEEYVRRCVLGGMVGVVSVFMMARNVETSQCVSGPCSFRAYLSLVILSYSLAPGVYEGGDIDCSLLWGYWCDTSDGSRRIRSNAGGLQFGGSTL